MRVCYKGLFVLLILFVHISGFGQAIIGPSDKHIAYMGRVDVAKDSTRMFWPGSSATIKFKGTDVDVTMKSLHHEGYFYAIIDNDFSTAFKFRTDSIKKTISLAKGLSNGKHTLMIYKVSNCVSEDIIYDFHIRGSSKLLKLHKNPSRKIEFYGNSITAGHGVDRPADMSDSGKLEYFNNFYSYAALTARHFNAQYSCIARSGIGVMLSWFPEIMPEIYDRLDPTDPKSKWDFTKYRPDIVVVNLFQNDSWLIKRVDHEQFKYRFGETKPTDEFIINSYQDFISLIRNKYPNAEIICALGNMDVTKEGSKWTSYIQQAVDQLNDTKIHTIVFPCKNSPGHPTKEEQALMADQLILFIEKNIKW